MKKVLIAMFALIALFVATVPAKAFVDISYAPAYQTADIPSSWQEWYGPANNLVVHETNVPTSKVCFSGMREDYAGDCFVGATPTTQYVDKQNAIKGGTKYVDIQWVGYYGKK